MNRILVGFHVSIAGGMHKAFERARNTGCTTFQIFTGNPRSWRRKSIEKEKVASFLEASRRTGIRTYFAHLPYLANFAAKGEIYIKSIEMLKEELRRCLILNVKGLVIHPGKLKGMTSEKEGLKRIAQAIDTAVASIPGVNVLIENTAGQGTEVGYKIEHIEEIILRSNHPDRIGVCIDTAHAFQAGYPIHDPDGLDRFICEIEKRIEIERLKLVHLNDSKSPFASRVDRHWHIAMGEIGEEGFKTLLSHPVIISSPMIMETPWGDQWDKRNMAKIKQLLGIFSVSLG